MDDRGFEIVEGVVPLEACDLLLERLRGFSGVGARGLMGDPLVASLARRRDLMAMARRWVGPEAVPFRATLFDKSALRNWFVAWHQDASLPLESRVASAEWGPWSVKAGALHARAPGWALEKIVALRIHLDASTPDNGPLKVIPGSHRSGVLSTDDLLRIAHDGRAEECLADRGGIVVMRPLLIHASSRAAVKRPRRVLHVEYAASLEVAPGIRLKLS